MSEMTTEIDATIQNLLREFDTIAHNVANAGTVGYKRRINTFSQALAEQGAGTLAEAGYEDPEVVYTTFDFSQGSLTETRRTLDFALNGKGFFAIETPDGPLYTRNGMFRLNQDGQIVDSLGRTVAGESGPITIPPTVGLSQISVSHDGRIQAAGLPVGQFRLVDFQEDESQLVSVGFHAYRAPEGMDPEPAESLQVMQGFKEGSNVQLFEEMIDMIMVTRLYEANMKLKSSGTDTSQGLLSVALG